MTTPALNTASPPLHEGNDKNVNWFAVPTVSPCSACLTVTRQDSARTWSRVCDSVHLRPYLPVLLLALTLAVPTQAPGPPLFSVELKTAPSRMGERVRAQLTPMLRALDEATLVQRGGELVPSVAVAAQPTQQIPVTRRSVVLMQPVRGELLQGLVAREQHHVVRSLTSDTFRVVNHWMLVEPGANVRKLRQRAVARFEAEVLEPEKATRRILARRGVTVVSERLSQLGYQRGPRYGSLGPQTKAAIRAFQTSRGLPVDGEYSLYLVRRLGTETKRREPASLQ
jgi:hypothetical protein